MAVRPDAQPDGKQSGDAAKAGRRTPGRFRRLFSGKARHAAAEESAAGFRIETYMPSDADVPPDTGQMIGICAWATALGVAGLAVAFRGLYLVVLGLTPVWYQPAFIATGMLGILLTVGAFMTIQRRHAPWVLLSLATLPLAGNIALTIIAV